MQHLSLMPIILCLAIAYTVFVGASLARIYLFYKEKTRD